MPIRTRFLALLAGAALLAGCGSSSSSSSSTPSQSTARSSAATTAQLGFEGVRIQQGADVASAASTQLGRVDGITCGATEQLAYHIHSHLAVYANGQPRTLPGGIGIPGSSVQSSPQGPVAAGGQCIYWLHTHAPDGVVHVESPTQRVYTLGNFFDEWHQPLGPGRVGGAVGKVTAYVNGKRWTKDPRLIPIEAHAVIQLDLGSPVVPFHPLSWSGLQL